MIYSHQSLIVDQALSKRSNQFCAKNLLNSQSIKKWNISGKVKQNNMTLAIPKVTTCSHKNRYTNRIPVSHRYQDRENKMVREQAVVKYLQKGKKYISKTTKQYMFLIATRLIRIINTGLLQLFLKRTQKLPQRISLNRTFCKANPLQHCLHLHWSRPQKVCLTIIIMKSTTSPTLSPRLWVMKKSDKPIFLHYKKSRTQSTQQPKLRSQR